MPIDKSLDFVGIDEIQMCSDQERGHIFTDRLLNLRGQKLTMFMGSNTISSIISNLNEDVEFIKKGVPEGVDKFKSKYNMTSRSYITRCFFW